MDEELELLPCPQRMIGGRCNLPSEVVSRPGEGLVSIYCILGHVYSGAVEFVTAP